MGTSLVSRIASLLDAIGIAFYQSDAEGRIAFVNRSFEELLGYSANELVGSYFGNLIYSAGEPSGGAAVDQGEATATAIVATFVHEDGSLVHARISSEPVLPGTEGEGRYGAVVPIDPRSAKPEPPRGREISLTRRQLEVLQLLAEGLGTSEIAAALTISPETARNHIRAILQELGCHSRLEAVVVARRLGLVS